MDEKNQSYDLNLFDDSKRQEAKSRGGAHYSTGAHSRTAQAARSSSAHSSSPRPAAPRDPAPAKKPKKKPSRAKTVVKRFFLTLLVVLLLVIVAAYSLLYTVANGPSPTVRNLLVLSAMQASATKWVPGLFLSKETVAQILKDSEISNVDVVPIDEYTQPEDPTNPDGPGQEKDEWADAIDGIVFETVNGPTYKAYVLKIKDPSRLYVGTSSDYHSGKQGAVIFDLCEREGAVAAINGGEFSDIGGVGTGDTPMGLTYSKGACVWDDGNYWRTFIGMTADNKLYVNEGISKDKAAELGIRDGVCFQNNNVLLTSDGESVSLHYFEDNTGTAQRTAIGQRADGTMILIVTDGRTASSLGATHNDMVDLMVSYGAINAAKLDGGSSSLMYYKDYFDLYNIDKDTLDQYQARGLVNKYKAFTTPRKIPTYWCVAPVA